MDNNLGDKILQSLWEKGKIPTKEDIDQLSMHEPIIHLTYDVMRAHDLTFEQGLMMCVVHYCRNNRSMMKQLMVAESQRPIQYIMKDGMNLIKIKE